MSVGVIVVSYNTGQDIIDCIESLLSQGGGPPEIAVINNASTDQTIQLLEEWLEANSIRTCRVDEGEIDTWSGTLEGRIAIIESGFNRGFAGGVNHGLKFLGRFEHIQNFWILNPDTIADPNCVQSIIASEKATHGYGLMGGRVLYSDQPPIIQIDGGLINFWTGVSSNVNLGRDPNVADLPDGSELDFVTGASLVASRDFVFSVGPMAEDYFLYYEEVDWALRRQDMPIVVSPGLVVWHRAGTAIGSRTLSRSPSAFSCWFLYRSRMRFTLKHRPLALPVAFIYAVAKATQFALRGELAQAKAIVSAIFAIGIPSEVRSRLSGKSLDFIQSSIASG